MGELAEGIVFHCIPHIKEKEAARFEHTVRFARGAPFVREEHQTELADHRIKRPVGKRQTSRIRLLPLHSLIAAELERRIAKHRFVQVRCQEFRGRRQASAQNARQDAGAAGHLQNGTVFLDLEPRRQIICIWLEQDRPEVAIIASRD